MVDAPDRGSPRFPSKAVPLAEQAIAGVLDQLAVGPNDRAVSSGASGGDLIFAEACLHRGMKLDLFFPFERDRFVASSVRPAGEKWVRRFDALLASPAVETRFGEDGNLDEQAFARCNLAMLDFALKTGAQLEFICLWNGDTGDGPGGTEHMVQSVQSQGGRVHWIDTRELG
jgi:hypothetical protein